MLSLLQFAGGLVLLLIGGRLLVTAAVALATKLHVPPLLIGLTLVAWGTSAPELAFNLTSAINGKPDLVVGNVIGANICNMGLVLGIAALLTPLVVSGSVVRREIPLMVGMFALVLVVSQIRALEEAVGGRLAPGLLLLVFLGYTVWVIRAGLRERRTNAALARQTEQSDLMPPSLPVWLSAIMMVGGMALLGFGGTVASDAATAIAVQLGMSQRVVGLTVVAVGTTMPELITSILAVRKGQVDLAMGNAVGSCLFNVGAIFSLCELVSPVPMPAEATASLVTMVLMGALLIPMSRKSSRKIARLEGALLLLMQGAFVTYELWRSKGG